MELRDKIIAGFLGALATVLGLYALYSVFNSSQEEGQTEDVSVEVQSAASVEGQRSPLQEGTGKEDNALPTPSTTQSSQSDQQEQKGYLHSMQAYWTACPLWKRCVLGIAVILVGGVVIYFICRIAKGLPAWNKNRKIQNALKPLAIVLQTKKGAYGKDIGGKQSKEIGLLSDLIEGYNKKQNNLIELLEKLANEENKAIFSNWGALLLFLEEDTNYALLYFTSGKDNRDNRCLAKFIAEKSGVAALGNNNSGGGNPRGVGMTFKQADRYLSLMKKAGSYLPEYFAAGVKKLKQASTNLANVGTKQAAFLGTSSGQSDEKVTIMNMLGGEERVKAEIALLTGGKLSASAYLAFLGWMPASFFLLKKDEKNDPRPLADHVVRDLNLLIDGHQNDSTITKNDLTEVRDGFIDMMVKEVRYKIETADIKTVLEGLANLLVDQNTTEGSYGKSVVTEVSDRIKEVKFLIGGKKAEGELKKLLKLLSAESSKDSFYILSSRLLSLLKEGSNYALLYLCSSEKNEDNACFAKLIAEAIGFEKKSSVTAYKMIYKQASDFLVLLEKAGAYRPEGFEEGLEDLKKVSKEIDEAGKELAKSLSANKQVAKTIAEERSALQKLFLAGEPAKLRSALATVLENDAEHSLSGLFGCMPASFFLLKKDEKSDLRPLADHVVRDLNLLIDGHQNDSTITKNDLTEVRDGFIDMMVKEVRYKIETADIKTVLEGLANLLVDQNTTEGSYGKSVVTEVSDRIKEVKFLIGGKKAEGELKKLLKLLSAESSKDSFYILSSRLLSLLKEGSNYALLYLCRSENNKDNACFAKLIAEAIGFEKKSSVTAYKMTYKQASDFSVLLGKAGTYRPEGFEDGLKNLEDVSKKIDEVGLNLGIELSKDTKDLNAIKNARSELKKLFFAGEPAKVGAALAKILKKVDEDNLSVLDWMPACFFLLEDDGISSLSSKKDCFALDVVSALGLLIKNEKDVDGKVSSRKKRLIGQYNGFIEKMKDEVGYIIEPEPNSDDN